MDRYDGRGGEDGEQKSFSWPAKAANPRYVRDWSALSGLRSQDLISTFLCIIYLLTYLLNPMEHWGACGRRLWRLMRVTREKWKQINSRSEWRLSAWDIFILLYYLITGVRSFFPGVGDNEGVWRTEVLQQGPGAARRWGSGGKPPEADDIFSK